MVLRNLGLSMENSEKDIYTNNNMKQSNELMISFGSALLGYTLGGPIGAVVTNTSLPFIKLTTNLIEGWLERRAKRMCSIVNNAVSLSGMGEGDILQHIQDNPEWGDDVIKLLQYMFDTDAEFDSLYTILLSKLFKEEEDDEEKRIILLGSSIRGLNKVQLSIMIEIGRCGGQMSANEISSFLSIPEWELRNAVRDLELRGIITDNDTNPTIWYLRELGEALLKIRTINDKNNEK